MNTLPRCELPRIRMLGIALFQGLAVFALYKAIDLNVWPHDEPAWLFALFTLAIATPLLAMLAICKESISRTLSWLLPFSALAVAAAAYTGWQAEPVEFIRPSTLAWPFILTIGIACFKAMMYIQQHGSGEPFGYAALFRHSWRNFLVVGLGLLFVGIFWGILMLWAALFKAIDIEFFDWLFKKDWFIFPVLGLANGVAIVVFRNLTAVIDVIARLLQAMIKFLLPLLAGVSIMFLSALPFTGLEALWGTGNGSLLVLWLQALMLFYVNAVYQDETQDSPYPLVIHRFIYAGVAILPVYSAIAFYGLYLRVVQYGWTIGRGWGLLIWLLLALFATGYLWGIVRHRDDWIKTLSRVNIAMGLVVLASMLLVNSPLLDLRKIALNSQFARLDSGETTLEDFDIRYISRHLGRPGYLALQELKTEISADHPELVTEIDNLYRPRDASNEPPDLETFTSQLVIWPADAQLPYDFIEALHTRFSDLFDSWQNLQRHVLIEADLNDDGTAEYVFVEYMDSWGSAKLWRKTDGKWVENSNMLVTGNWSSDVRKRVETGQITIVRPEWKQIRIGDLTLRVSRTANKDAGE